jgi:hypothetical protein
MAVLAVGAGMEKIPTIVKKARHSLICFAVYCRQPRRRGFPPAGRASFTARRRRGSSPQDLI